MHSDDRDSFVFHTETGFRLATVRKDSQRLVTGSATGHSCVRSELFSVEVFRSQKRKLKVTRLKPQFKQVQTKVNSGPGSKFFETERDRRKRPLKNATSSLWTSERFGSCFVRKYGLVIGLFESFSEIQQQF